MIKTYPEKRILKWLKDIINFLAQLQVDFGLSHRDLKPNNMFLKNEKIFVGDFGSMRKVANE